MSEQGPRPRRLAAVEVVGMGAEEAGGAGSDAAAMWECLASEDALLDELERVTAQLRKVRDTKAALANLGVDELRAGLARRAMTSWRGTR